MANRKSDASFLCFPNMSHWTGKLGLLFVLTGHFVYGCLVDLVSYILIHFLAWGLTVLSCTIRKYSAFLASYLCYQCEYTKFLLKYERVDFLFSLHTFFMKKMGVSLSNVSKKIVLLKTCYFQQNWISMIWLEIQQLFMPLPLNWIHPDLLFMWKVAEIINRNHKGFYAGNLKHHLFLLWKEDKFDTKVEKKKRHFSSEWTLER